MASNASSEAVSEGPRADTGATETTTQEPEESGTQGTDELPLDVVFGILKNQRRRLVLEYLVDVTEETTLSDLAEYIAALENEKPEPELTSSERKRVYVCLYQCHLPKMDDAGVIEFETDRGTVELANDVDEFTQYLDLSDDGSARDWPRYYIALAVVGGSAFVAQGLLFPSAILSGVVIGAMLGLYANLALEHAYNRGILHPRRDDRGDPADADPT